MHATCETANECTLSCQRYKYYCEAVIYDSEDKICELHASALLNYTSATSPNNLTYYESLCALHSPIAKSFLSLGFNSLQCIKFKTLINFDQPNAKLPGVILTLKMAGL
ncbi:hypothetical protein EB796_025078 [Bugula neritina]|uniref:Apple domain-containing protein n=1 Tax=Bugula neritina TaxID=10212 RepID=A0A7J7ITR7_BUGNE|nr:hypothetical protein EB796_025078 [Bugula neritina]